MNSGYSKTPLAKKIGLKTNFKIHLYNTPDYYHNLFDKLSDDIEYQTFQISNNLDFIHAFFTLNEDLTQTIQDLKNRLKKWNSLGKLAKSQIENKN